LIDVAHPQRSTRRHALFLEHSAGSGRNVLLAFVLALASGWAVVERHSLAVALAAVPVIVWLLLRPVVAAVLVGATLPLATNVAGGHAGGVNVSLSDLLLVAAVFGIFLAAALGRTSFAVQSLRPVAAPVLLYSVFILVLLGVHLGGKELLQTGQRYELFLLPLVVGAFVALQGQHVRVLQAYVLACTALAVIWPIDHLGLQKNPTGQMIGDAILVLVGVRVLRRLFVCLPFLVLGLLLTQSRGAVVAAAVGLVVLMILSARPGGFFARRGLVVVLGGLLAFALLPASTQDRLTNYTASASTLSGNYAPGSYALYIRQQYNHDAHLIIDAHPWVGVGVGNYLAGDPTKLTQAQDPHDVILLQAAEGGYGFAAAFVLLVLGTILALVRLGRRVELAPVAAAVVLSTVAHGLVDVYWVRGTPVLGWLLVGMACGCAWSARGEAVP
jgi:hypothetical protein